MSLNTELYALVSQTPTIIATSDSAQTPEPTLAVTIRPDPSQNPSSTLTSTEK